jgi:hypothetical protein
MIICYFWITANSELSKSQNDVRDGDELSKYLRVADYLAITDLAEEKSATDVRDAAMDFLNISQ